MTDGGKKFLWGVAVGLAAAALIKTDTFRKCCSKIVAGGFQLKNDAVVALRTGNVIPVDGTVVRGDCLAVNENGGYSLFEFFTQNPTLNKKSLVRLREKITVSGVKLVCTGHSGIRTDMSKLFAHIDESAVSKLGKPFDPTAPKSIRK